MVSGRLGERQQTFSQRAAWGVGSVGGFHAWSGLSHMAGLTLLAATGVAIAEGATGGLSSLEQALDDSWLLGGEIVFLSEVGLDVVEG